MKYLSSHEERQDFLTDQNLTYYKLVGGLGNQLFGLSRAHLLYKEIGKKVAIDVTNLDHTSQAGPEWMDWSGLEEWCEIVESPKELRVTSQIWNLINSLYDAPQKTNCYTGWNLSLAEVLESGLFEPHQFPFSAPHDSVTCLGIHMRGGDYRNAKGIGLLDWNYYKRALDFAPIKTEETTTIFTDDLEYATAIVKCLGSSFKPEYSLTSSPLGVLAEMSAAKKLIGSNSTLSWWAAFFSKSKIKILPKPMYLQTWTADKEIIFQDVQYLSRFKNKFKENYEYILWKYIRR